MTYYMYKFTLTGTISTRAKDEEQAKINVEAELNDIAPPTDAFADPCTTAITVELDGVIEGNEEETAPKEPLNQYHVVVSRHEWPRYHVEAHSPEEAYMMGYNGEIDERDLDKADGALDDVSVYDLDMNLIELDWSKIDE